MDTDFAKEQSNSIRLQILQQTATTRCLNEYGPQAVLGFLGSNFHSFIYLGNKLNERATSQ